MSIAVMDTSVFCNVLDLPGYNQNRNEVIEDLRRRIERRETLLLPIAAVLETGNHVGQVKDGAMRRRFATDFRDQVIMAIDGTAPWSPTPFWDMENLKLWLADFPDHAMRKLGMGDLSIVKEWERQCLFHPARRITIWSLDGHLDTYDREV